MSLADEIANHELALLVELHGRSPASREKELNDRIELCLTIADALEQQGDIDGAIELYERAMVASREIDRLY